MAPASGALSGLIFNKGTTRAEQLAAAVEKRVREGTLTPGSPLGTLDDLQAASGVSRPTVNEAVSLLRERGVVRIKPGRGGGLFVARPGPVVRLRHTLLSVAEEPATVMDAIELRDHLELLIDLGAARCRNQREVEELRHLLDLMAKSSDWSTFIAANWRLHERIAAISPNSMARAVYVGTMGHLSASSASYADGADSSAYRAERYAVHVELVDAIESGDPERVRAAVARHHRSS